MTDDTQQRPDALTSLGDDYLTFGDVEDIQDEDDVERAIDTKQTKIDGVKKVSAFVADFGDVVYAMEYEESEWVVVDTTEDLGSALSLFED